VARWRARDDSPWYTSLRQVRQPAYGDWGGVIRDVATRLQAE
jgi:hypothetical protein